MENSTPVVYTMRGFFITKNKKYMNATTTTLTVREVADTLIAWTASCDRLPQLELIDQCIDRFLIHRFLGDSKVAHEVNRVMIVLQRKASDLVQL